MVGPVGFEPTNIVGTIYARTNLQDEPESIQRWNQKRRARGVGFEAESLLG